MRIVTLDFETHYAADYSLSKMSPLEYVMDDRFQTISCSIKVDNHNTDVFFGEAAVRKAFKSVDGIIRDSLLLAHNMAGFDAYVCAYRYDLKPKLWGCTMAMARPIHAKTTGLGLAKLVAHYGLGVKDNTVLVQTRGKRLEDFTPQELEAMRKYNREDTDQCRALFDRLRKHYTPAELWQIDAIIRMRTEPAFVLDVPMLETAASIERTRKHKALLDLARDLNPQGGPALDWSDEGAVTEFVRGELASAPKFSAMLEKLGVEVPTKPSPTNPDRTVPALAKTDEAFIALQEHDDPLVSAAARARLDVKSTLLETRIQKFLTAGKLAGGYLPIPLQYCGADTTGRDSGCLVADTEVLVYSTLTDSVVSKRVVDVLMSDLVWDGEEFVAHGGVVFSGFAEVITWDGVTGTEDHVVFTEDGEISLSEARSRGVPIKAADHPTKDQVDTARKHTNNYKGATTVPLRLR